MASNIAEVELKKNIVFVRCEVVIFEVLKACVYLGMAYLLVVRACFFAIAQPRVSCSCSSTCLTKPGRVSQGWPGRTDGNLALLRNSKDKRCWAKASYTNIHFIFFQLSWTSLATDILLWSSSHCFFCLFLSSFGYKPASRREQLSTWAASKTFLRTFPRRRPILL